jgi:tight adherence protein B
MDPSLILILLVCFLAVVFLIEGAYLLWSDTRGPEVRQLARRLRSLEGGRRSEVVSSLLKARAPEVGGLFGRLVAWLPRTAALAVRLQQAGIVMSASRFLFTTALLMLSVFLVLLVLRQPTGLALLMGLVSGAVPFLWLARRRERRMQLLDAQLPDAVELIARALRAGHPLAPALQMVAEELPEPISGEFGITFDEISYGVSLSDAMLSLAGRVPAEDLRFFAVAVVLQRETGGNLAEILDNIGKLIRERFKLLGTIRVLSAEGRLSAWILSLLPFATALLISLVNPDFMRVLWSDPTGFKMTLGAMVLMAVGVFWLTRIVKIRV